MHEWALAEGTIQTVVEFAKNNNAKKVVKIVIVLGELQDIEREIVEYALNQLKSGTVADEAKIEFETEEALFKCRACGYEWNLKKISKKLNPEIREDIHFVPEVVHSFLTCPNCGSRDFEVVKGRGIYIKEIEVM